MEHNINLQDRGKEHKTTCITRRADRAGREGGPRRPGRAGGFLKRGSCMNREEVLSCSAIPK
eukprot:8283924-Pyramimonas_sp.AAC.1